MSVDAPPPITPTQRSFIDTNMLIYADSPDEPLKQEIASQLLAQLRLRSLGVMSTQVLQEFANVGLKKLKLRHDTVRKQLAFYKGFELFSITPEIIDDALDLHQTRSLGFYDALILASARVAGCSVLYSEDLNAGEIVAGVKVVNPFA
jgi:predicted nucleic acid-binding protein